MRKIDLTGKKFNRLTVIKQAEHHRGEIYWECICDCGKIAFATSNKLTKERVKSCGCLNDEMRRSRTAKMTAARSKYTPAEASARRVWEGRYSDGDVDFETFKKLSSQNCYYCAQPPMGGFNAAKSDSRRSDKAKSEGLFIYNGLDRKDQSLPHNLNNIVVCCKLCNMTKRNMHHDDFIRLITRIYDNLVKGS